MPYENFKTFGFIDDRAHRTRRSGSGPDGDYDYLSRKHNAHIIQAAFLSEYLKGQRLKYQTVLLPNGLWGSVAMRRNHKGILCLT